MLKTEGMNEYAPVSDERVSKIVNTEPEDGIEKDAIIRILMNFGLSRQEIIDTLEWKTAEAIKKVDFDLVHSFLRSIRNRK